MFACMALWLLKDGDDGSSAKAKSTKMHSQVVMRCAGLMLTGNKG